MNLNQLNKHQPKILYQVWGSEQQKSEQQNRPMTTAAGRRNALGRNPDFDAKERDLLDREERLAQVLGLFWLCIRSLLTLLRDREERLAQACTGDMCCWCA
jgi:hypothetical protein